MAVSISSVVNIPVYILTPTIALMLHSVMKIGRKGFWNRLSVNPPGINRKINKQKVNLVRINPNGNLMKMIMIKY